MKTLVKTITIKQTTKEDGTTTAFIVKGNFSDFEKIGILEYYKNAITIEMLRSLDKKN
jgi:hypothetical protein